MSGWFQIVGDFGGHYGSRSVRTEDLSGDFPAPASINVNSDSSVHTILLGPRFSSRRDRKLTLFAQFLFGAARLGADASIRLGNTTIDTAFADISFAVASGGGLDLNLSESVALRLVQADYLSTNFGSNAPGHLRLSVGIVLR
jgi:hypothetical protein